MSAFRNILFFTAATLAIAPGAWADPCETGGAFETASSPRPAGTKWRMELTNPNQDGGYSATKRSRETRLKSAVEEMTKDVLDESTPLMRTEFADGTDWDYRKESEGYGTGTIDRVVIRGVGDAAAVDATMLLPVSGHTGVANAKKWALSDTYDIVWKGRDVEKTLISHAKSRGLVTIQEVRIPLIKGRVVKVSYHRSGSLGPAGFREGRVIELVWDGT